MRIRQIRPEFFTDPVTGRLSPVTQVVYIGLWCVADDAGWLTWDVEQLGALLYPYKSGHVRTQIIEKAAQELAEIGKLRIETCGCALIPTLVDHQKLGGNRSYIARDKHRAHRSYGNLGSLDESGQVRTSPPGRVGNGKERDGTREAASAPHGAASLKEALLAAGMKPELVS